MGLISSEKKIMGDKNFNNIIQGKKIDFNDEAIFNENEPNKSQNQQNIIINNINNQNINYKQNISLSNKKIINHTYNNVLHERWKRRRNGKHLYPGNIPRTDTGILRTSFGYCPATQQCVCIPDAAGIHSRKFLCYR